jgi:DNA-directed RNA polymerase subunit RPC12/RpoP
MKAMTEWRCAGCGALAGKVDGSELQIEQKKWRYRVALPAAVTCPHCGATSVMSAAEKKAA